MKIFSRQYFEDLLGTASQSHRLRAHANVHRSYSEQCQKLFNTIMPNSYIRPHRHSLDPKEECLIAIKGLFGLIIFTDEGLMESVTVFGSEKYSEKLFLPFGLELPAEAWHTVISLADDSVLFEVKNGPFKPGIAKEFAPWAPAEDDEEAQEYLNELKQRVYDQLSWAIRVENRSG
jgi:cupin fold WbuC family metalloprotein